MSMNRPTLWLHFSLTLTLLAALSLMSYFGYPNPVIVGLQSSVAIGLLLIDLRSAIPAANMSIMELK